jgi:lysophospholipid acyltransferase (LPLAT)-like uncharacterized protein
VVLTTPSLAGPFAAAAIARLGVASVPMRSDTRGVASADAFLACVAAGDVGCILVDGPRGPAGVVKAGVARTVAAAHAEVMVAEFAPSAGVRVPSWDRTLLPAPFARVHVALRAVAAPASEDAIQAALDGVAVEARRAAGQRTG